MDVCISVFFQTRWKVLKFEDRGFRINIHTAIMYLTSFTLKPFISEDEGVQDEGLCHPRAYSLGPEAGPETKRAGQCVLIMVVKVPTKGKEIRERYGFLQLRKPKGRKGKGWEWGLERDLDTFRDEATSGESACVGN